MIRAHSIPDLSATPYEGETEGGFLPRAATVPELDQGEEDPTEVEQKVEMSRNKRRLRPISAEPYEFVYVLEGKLVLVEDARDTVLRPGDSAGWPCGVPDGHHLQNRTEAGATFGFALSSPSTLRAQLEID